VSRALKALHRELEAAGLQPDTNEFKVALRARKVEMCKAMHNVSSCWDCDYFDQCELIKTRLCDMYEVERWK
jgi:hypothetical protein